MLNYAETTCSRTIVPVSPNSSQQPLPLLSAEVDERAQGERTGRTEFSHLYEQAAVHKGEPLTTDEINELYGTHFLPQIDAWQEGTCSRTWFNGWGNGFVNEYLHTKQRIAAQTVPREDEPPPQPLLTAVSFRRATILVDDPAVFKDAILSGQDAHVQGMLDGMVVTAAGLFQDIADAVTHDDPNMTPTWLVGYFLGCIDALLRDRKTPPRGW